MVYQAVASVLDAWRGERTYSDVARATGLSVPSVSAIFRGESVPKEETLAVLCGVLGHSPADLLAEAAERVKS